MELKERSGQGLRGARQYTEAMLGLQVWSHKLDLTIKATAHEGHEDHEGE
jgi:hypothetical protein